MESQQAPAAPVPMNTKFVVKHAFGSHATKVDSLLSYAATGGEKESTDRVLFKVGRQVCIYDPEGGKQEFFDNRPKLVTDVVHVAINSNSRFIAMCEMTRSEKTFEVMSQVSIYSLTNMNKIRSLSHANCRPFACSTFCGDPKLIAALTEEPDRQIVVWQWEKAEKFYKGATLTNVNANLLRAAPSYNLMLTTTGVGSLKFWCLAADSTLKYASFLPPSKEGNETFIDHMWLTTSLGINKLVLLADVDAPSDTGPKQQRQQKLFVFEGIDQEVPHGGSGSASAPTPPIAMELRQIMGIKMDHGAKMEKIVPSSKAFMMIGMQGLVAWYERTDDKHEPYIETRRIHLGDFHFVGGTILPSEDKMALLTKAGRTLLFHLDVPMDQMKKDGSIASGAGEEGEASVMNNSLEDDNNSSALDSLEKIRSRSHHGLNDLLPRGYHCSPIIASDIAHERPMLVTIAADNTARVWNYITLKCEIIYNFRNDEPIAVALHPNGFQILVSFKDRIRLYNILMNTLKQYKETILKNCKCLKFSNGAQYWAAASAINVVIYETKSFQQLMTFQGHMMTVIRMVWAPGDQVLFSAGMDGNIYGWPIAKDGRIDVAIASNRSSQIHDIVADCPSTVFQVTVKDTDEESTSVASLGGKGSAAAASAVSVSGNIMDRHWLVVSSLDGNIRMPAWSLEQSSTKHGGGGHSTSRSSADMLDIIKGDSSVSITCMQLSADRTKLFCGTSVGSLRVYAWPPVNNAASLAAPSVATHTTPASNALKDVYAMQGFYELFSHASSVVAIKLSPVDNTVISAAADGSVFIHNIVANDNLANAHRSSDPFELVDESAKFNREVVLMSVEDIEDHVNEVIELQKTLNETRAKNDFHARKLESDHNETLKKINEIHDLTLNKEKEGFEKQRHAFEKRIRELMGTIEIKETDHIKVITELENKYEHKIADQLERYDVLSEKMRQLEDRCTAKLEDEKAKKEKELNEFKEEARTREKRLKQENRRALDDKQANESAFKEIIQQQEDEYEDELRQLIAAAEGELTSERDTIDKLRTLVKTKNTKLDQLKKKLIELSAASKARLTLLNHEKQEKQKLLDTIEHYKKNLIEREEALAEKEKMVLELRSTTRTLENFRFVLDHRLQQLSSERGPITSHIEGLEKHISTMYEELVEEFNGKKMANEATQLKDQKISWITQDLNKTRQNVREKEQYIAAFKRELGNIVSSMTVGKELEESVKVLYKKFVRGESNTKTAVKMNDQVADRVNEILNVNDDDNASVFSMESFVGGPPGTANKGDHRGMSRSLVREVEEALVETAKEADRQKTFVERQSNNLKHRLSIVQRESHAIGHHRLNENSNLLYECNELRIEVKTLQRKLEIKRNELDMAYRDLEAARNELKYVQKNTPMLTRPRTGDVATSKTPLLEPIPPLPAAAAAVAAEGEGGGEGMLVLTDELGVTTDTGHWIVHNSLQTSHSPVPNEKIAGIGNFNDAGSVHSVVGRTVGTNLAPLGNRHVMGVSQSEPTISKLAEIESALAKNMASTNKLLNNKPTRMSLMSTPPEPTAAEVTTKKKGKLVSHISLPRAERRKPSAATVNSDYHVEKLTREVDSLAVQLDDSIRDREMQRLELNQLRKQVMALSHGGVVSHSPHALGLQPSSSLSGPFGANHPSVSLQLPSIVAAPHSMNADVYGVPSSEDKEAMRLGPAGVNASMASSSASLKSRLSVSSQKAPSGHKPNVDKALSGGARKAADDLNTPTLADLREVSHVSLHSTVSADEEELAEAQEEQ